MNSKHVWAIILAAQSSILMYKVFDQLVNGVLHGGPAVIAGVVTFSCVTAMMFAWPEGQKVSLLGLVRIGWRFWVDALTYMGLQAFSVMGSVRTHDNGAIYTKALTGILLFVILTIAVQTFFPKKKPASQTTDS